MEMFRDLLDLAGTVASNEVLKERLALAVDRGEAMEAEKERLEAQVAQLEGQLREALHQLATARQAEEFVEHQGALFKRTGSGYVNAVYCPSCRTSVGSMQRSMPFYCQRCKWMANFTGGQLEMVMRSLPS